MICDICGGQAAAMVCTWTFRCPTCRLWQSTLVPAIEGQGHPLSEDDRERGLAHIRAGNFNRILDRLSRWTALDGRRLLDVGCAYGWFMEAAVARRMAVVGIEPDFVTAHMAQARGLEVIQGYFPQSVPASRKFDVVVFNDVLEHLPDVQGMLAACARVMAPDGFLILSLPTSAGTLFRLAAMLARAGWQGPWNRLWQQAFPSPHLYYFNRRNLDTALIAHGFQKAEVCGTDVFHPKGLWSRMKFDRRTSLLLNAFLYLGLLAAYPLYRAFGHPDTELLIYQLAAAPGTDPADTARR